MKYPISISNAFHCFKIHAIMHLVDVQPPNSMTVLLDITMVSWKLLRLSAARWKAILARGKYMEMIVDQVIMTTSK